MHLNRVLMASTQDGPDILLVEDNPGDVELFQLAFEESDIPGTLHVASDGVAALAFLRDEENSGTAPPVDIVILDLNLPEKHGTEVLREIRDDPDLKTIPVLILSTSGAKEDINQAYYLGANAYLTKRMAFDDTLTLVEALNNFWFEVTSLPSE